MKQLFHIANSRVVTGEQVLSLKIGEKHASFSITNKAATELSFLAYCTVEQWNENELNDFYNAYPVLATSYYKIIIAYDYPQNTLVPARDFQSEENNTVLNNLLGEQGAVSTIAETIPEWLVYNVYAVPQEVQQWVANKFAAVSFHHQFSVAIKNIEAAAENGSMAVDFRKDDLTILVAKHGKLLLAQSFEYSTPEDVLYYLLNISKQFSLSQQETQLYLTGLIDKNSSLYSELFQYFIQIDFRNADWKHNEYPAHFFTTLNDLARCAS